jgi:hypothetical protein
LKHIPHQLNIYLFRLNFPKYLHCSANSYDETKNVRSFTNDAMWGSIGGYVGMVLGISFFQLPNLICDAFKALKMCIIRNSKGVVEPIENKVQK